jgi:hypothetical protein
MVVVVFVAFYVTTLNGSIFGVMHTPATPKFELFLWTSSITSSNFLQTKFEEVWRKSPCSENFKLFRIVQKRKTFCNLFDFVKFSIFLKKTFPGGPLFKLSQARKMFDIYFWHVQRILLNTMGLSPPFPHAQGPSIYTGSKVRWGKITLCAEMISF